MNILLEADKHLHLIVNKLSAKKRIVRDATKKETVILPMQPNFSESNAVSWGGDNLNPLQMYCW